MAKTKFVFDKESGTLKPQKEALTKTKAILASEGKQVDEVDMKNIDLSTVKPNADTGEDIVQFRESSDLTIFQILEERSRKPMMVIAGYGLEIKFNMSELRTTERIEQLLDGLSDMFRKMIVEQALSKPEK